MRYVTRKEITSKLNFKIELVKSMFVRDFSYKILWLKSYEKVKRATDLLVEQSWWECQNCSDMGPWFILSLQKKCKLVAS